jgi:choline dehydrogenase-like flavoprotein
MATEYDVIIIGTGAGGGTLLHALAPTGKRILVLERGGFVPRELENWDTKAVNLDARYNTREVWRDKDGQPLHPHTNYFVGGNTKFYGAALFRLRREDFGEIKHWGGCVAGVAHRLRRARALLSCRRAALSRARRAR